MRHATEDAWLSIVILQIALYYASNNITKSITLTCYYSNIFKHCEVPAIVMLFSEISPIPRSENNIIKIQELLFYKVELNWIYKTVCKILHVIVLNLNPPIMLSTKYLYLKSKSYTAKWFVNTTELKKQPSIMSLL